MVWRSCQLDPASPRPGEPGHGTDVATYLGQKYGGGRDAGLQMNVRVSEVAAGDGLDVGLPARQVEDVFVEALRRARADRTRALVQMGADTSAEGSGSTAAGTPAADAEACGPDACAVPQP